MTVCRAARMFRYWALALLLAAGPATATKLTVSAASSLSESFRAMARAYQQAHPGTRVDLNFAASGVLLQQIARGAPVDVVAMADLETMALAQRDGLVDPATRHVFASNSLWLVLPADATQPPRSLAALAAAPIQRVAIGNPDSVPAGRYARRALQQAGLWTALQSRMITTQNVRQSLSYVVRGEVDAGFVYASDVQTAGPRVRQAFQVPVAGGIHYPLAVARHSRNPEQARHFIAFVRSQQGQAILRAHGFGSP